MTERYRYDQKTQETLEHLSVPFAVYQFVDKRVVTLVLSDGFCKLFGYEDRERACYDMDNDMYRGAHPDDVARIANAALRFATQGGEYEVIYRSRALGSSEYRVIHAFGEHVYTDTGVRLAQVWYSDEGPYREDPEGQSCGLNRSLSNALHENSMVKASQYDALTGLPGMTYFFELAELGKTEIQRPVMLFMDFRGMKFFNTKHGFAEGDRLLRTFGRILANRFGHEQCCRIGDDHFAAFTRQEGLKERLEELLRTCDEMNGGRNLPLHIGVYVGRNENVHTSTACDRAKLACDAISGKYESCVNYYSRALSEEASNRQYIIENLDRAISEQWIQVYLQPIIRAVNGLVSDVEALARWMDPVRGALSPASFIPALEEAGLIYKLDLYMVDQILKLIQDQQARSFYIIPHSINLSRSDFDACDMVEEIRRRVDAAGVPRDRITIELTESVVGRDRDFMREQVERFHALGFAVWMDDFGSGYSSLDILQSIQFDLLKFDMSFMQRLDEGENGKVLLTELMKMATALGVDTVCEGVETEQQVRFLQEIGCSKLQGFYYSKPISFDSILEMRRSHTLIGNENPAESEYYEGIGRVNLYDLGVVAGEEAEGFQHVFDTLPIAILEIRDGKAKYIRSNRSYQEFMRRFFQFDITRKNSRFSDAFIAYGDTFSQVVRQCCQQGSRVFFDERMPEGSIAHSFLRRISRNPVTGGVAVAIAILSVEEPDERETYVDIARALAADYYNLFVIDLDTDDYTEYASQVGGEELSVVRHGVDFFASARRDTMTRIYEEDRESFLRQFTKERVLRDLDKQGVFTTTYRLIDTGKPMYVNMKITRLHGGNRIILGISIIDANVRQEKEFEKLQQERETLVRLMALSDGYLSLFTVDPKTGHYLEYSSSEDFDSLGAEKDGTDFFGQAYQDAFLYCYPPDRERFQQQVTMDNVLREIRRQGKFSIHYRLIIRGEPRPVTLRAALFKDGGEEKLVIGVRARQDVGMPE